MYYVNPQYDGEVTQWHVSCWLSSSWDWTSEWWGAGSHVISCHSAFLDRVCVCVWIWKCIGRLYKEMGAITLARRKDDADQSHAELCDANMLWDLGCCYLWFTSILNAFNSKHLRTTGGALVFVNDRTYSTLQNYTPKAYIWNLYRVHIDLLTTTAAVTPQYKLYLTFTAFLVIKFKHKPQPLFSLDIHLFLQFMWIKNLI